MMKKKEIKVTEKEFSEKYCKKCSSLVCTGTEEEAAKGCKNYQKEVLGWQELNIPRIAPEKFSAELKLGNLVINLKDVTFTDKQIKNYKKYFNIEARNLDESVDKK